MGNVIKIIGIGPLIIYGRQTCHAGDKNVLLFSVCLHYKGHLPINSVPMISQPSNISSTIRNCFISLKIIYHGV